MFALFFIVSNIFCAYAQSTDGITTITPSVPPGAYPTDQIVNLVTNDDVDLYFTFDESRDQTFARYTVPIRLNALTGESRSYTLRVEARRNGLILKKKEFFYIIDRDPPELPAPTVAPGTYTSSVALSFDTSNFKSTDRLYTTVANTEIPAPALWDGVDIVLDVEEGSTSGYELRAYAIDSAGNSSCMGSWYYVIDRSVEQIPDKLRVYSPVPGEFANKQLLLIDPDGFDEIRYTFDGEDPLINGYTYGGPELIDQIGSITLEVFGYADGVEIPLARTILFEVIENSVDRLRTESGSYDEEILISIRDPADMRASFKNTPEALENTLKIAEMCDLKLEFGKNLIPAFNTPQNENPDVYLEQLCDEGLNDRFKGKKIPKEYMDRLKYELRVVKDMGFSTYFLIVHDFIKFAKDNAIIVGPGRGSAAGSIIAYSLRITELDPIVHGLFFERFLTHNQMDRLCH